MRNWDYRYCWLRDATFTLYALLSSGYREEAHAWREWLLRAVAGQPQQLQIMYGIGGERRLDEHLLPWLEGYAGSIPVRAGNDAHRQLQLDVFGEVMDSLHVARKAGVDPAPEAWELQKVPSRFPGGSLAGTPTKACGRCAAVRAISPTATSWPGWAADRAVKSVETFGLSGDAARWRALKAEIRDDVLRNGYDRKRNTFVQYYGGKALDAALLMIPMVGFLPCSDPRVTGTIAAIERGTDRGRSGEALFQ